MTKLKRLRIAMVLGCVLAIGAGVAYYLKSSGYEPSNPSSGVVLMMLIAGAVLAATSRRRRKQDEIDEKANKANA